MQHNTPGRKLVNATGVLVDGIKFKSKAEAYAHGLGRQLGVPLAYEGRHFVLVPGFTYQGQKEQAITHKPDFIDPDPRLRYVIEVKGYANERFPLYRKLFLRHLQQLGLDTKYYLCTDRKETQAALLDIKQRFFS